MNDSERDMMLARIDENVLHLKAAVSEHQGEDNTIHEKLADRLTSLETAHNRQRGAITAATAIVSALWAAIVAGVAWFWGK